MIRNDHLPFQADIQGLRAISIVLVVLSHAGVSFVEGGFIGVDLFFVISGYLITGLLLREQATQGRIAYGRFIGRRLKRLLPSLIAMIVVTTAAASFLLSGYEARQQMGSLIYATTWTSNLFFAFSNADYFAELANKDLFLHTWSLGVEEQFYLVWPLLLSLMGLWGITTRKNSLLAFLGLLFAVSLAACWYGSIQNTQYAFYLMPMRIWQFSLGAIVYVLFSSRESVAHCALIRATGLLLIAASAIFFTPELGYPGLWALVPSTGAALLLATAQSANSSPILSHPVMQWIGDRSYAWYLWHWPFLILGLTVFGAGNDGLLATLLVALSLATSALSYRWVELPFWRGALSHGQPRRTILVSLLAMLIVVSGGLLQINSRTAPATDQVQQAIARARADVPEIYSAGCDTWYYSAEVSACIGGNPNAEKTMVFIGDSIGAQWYSAFANIFGGGQWRIEVYTKSACPMVDEDYFYPRIGTVYAVCEEWRNSLLEKLSTRKIDTIIIGSSETYDFSESQWINGSARILQQLSPVGDRVLIIPGAPGLSRNGPGCIERLYQSDPEKLLTAASICSKPVGKDALATKVSSYLTAAATPFANSFVLNLNDLVCPKGICSALSSDGIIVYRDSHHLTNSFVLSQADAIKSRIDRLPAIEPP
ncbi:acyltransferase family protein [Aestuariirhabdus sp. LZHN29]|uniref:acyltransferase family protein n=1 Tax=Aestuariirhabdus sp. LZHN29 TaxID=3417462 RepID=UPI003CEFEC59